MPEQFSYRYRDPDGDLLRIEEHRDWVVVDSIDTSDNSRVRIVVRGCHRQSAAQALAGDEHRVVPVDRIDALSTDGRVTLYPARADRDEFPRVQGKCPTCGVGPLFLAEGGYVTCSWVDCKEPSAASELLHGVLPGEPIPEWERELLSQPRPEQPDRPEPVDPASVDPEIAALHQIVTAMNGLDKQEQERTVRYLSARYGGADLFMEQLTGHRKVSE